MNLFLELAELIVYTRPFLNLVSKAKAAKLVRNLVDMFLDLEAGTGEEVFRLCVIYSFVLEWRGHAYCIKNFIYLD